MIPTLTTQMLDRLAEVGRECGLLRLGAVSLADDGFERSRAAVDAFLDAGYAGQMGFLERTREVRKWPETMLEGARSLLVALVPYRGDAGPIARYAQAADYHTVMHRRLLVLAEALRRELPQVEFIVCVDTKPVPERAAAALAGLGFIGKHGCLIAPGLGSYVLIGGLLSTASWDGRAPAQAGSPWDACGECRACLDACPTNAFDAPGRLDPRRCISYLTIEHRGPVGDALADRMGERVAGCDVCQEVCPYNRGQTALARVPNGAWLPAPDGPLRRAELSRLAGLGNSQHRAFVKHTPLTRIPRRALRRNAFLAMGNREGPLDADEREVCEQAASDSDETVKAAANRVLAKRG